MKYRIAVIKADHTWEEMVVNFDAAEDLAPWQACVNAEAMAHLDIKAEALYPDGYVGLKCLGELHEETQESQ